MRTALISAALTVVLAGSAAAPAFAQGTYGGRQPWAPAAKPAAPAAPSAPKAPAAPAFKPYKGVSTYERPEGRSPYQAAPKPKAPTTSVFGPDPKRKTW
ncbi:hypothetical protein [Phenylobacterium sp.]|uniref:hypothetical protein n=1 Tax=Phenylobacterium sp. TaxID=1871053 RepID=UPI00301CBEAA